MDVNNLHGDFCFASDGGFPGAAPLVVLENYEPPSPSPLGSGSPLVERYRLLKANRVALRGLVRPGHDILGCQSKALGPVVTLHDRPAGSPGEARTGVSGVVTCKSVWACPVCSAAISAGRAAEIRQAIAQHRRDGGDVYLLTLTFRHSREQSLRCLLEGYKQAMRSMFRGAPMSRLLCRTGTIGRIGATEITRGGSGWHPHGHILLFADRVLPVDDIREAFGVLWQRALAVQGLDGIDEIACNLQSGSAIRDYLTKFSAEMSSVAVKQGRDGGLSPFQILALAGSGDGQAVAWWREYYSATKGRKALSWSRGLKKHFGIGNVEDAEIIASSEDGAPMLFVLSRDWRGLLDDGDRGYIKTLGRAQIVEFLVHRGVNFSYRPDDFSEEWDCVMNL